MLKYLLRPEQSSGGACSNHVVMYRINRLSWWKEALPSPEEYGTAGESLERCNWTVDYVISHCCPSGVQDILSGGFYQKDALTEFFEEVSQKLQFSYWFFGHYHDNRPIQPKYILLYEQILEIST